MGAVRFRPFAGLVTATTLVVCWSYTAACINFSQAKAIERLSKEGWIFGRIPDSRITWTQQVLLHAVSSEFLPVVYSAKAPRIFSNGTLSSSIADLRRIEGLEIVILNGGSLNAKDVLAIGKLVDCTELDLRFCEYNESLKDLGQSIGQLKLLRILRLSSDQLPGDFLRTMPVLEDLQVCELAGVRLESADLEHVVGFPRVRFIDISYSRFNLETLPESIRSKVSVSNPTFGRKILRVENEPMREPYK